MQLSGSTILVAGGASGLGEACVRRLFCGGAKLVIADLQDEAGRALAAELGETVRFAQTDVTSPEQVEAAITVATEQFGGLQAVINCAGILRAARVVGHEGPHDVELFSQVIQVNLTGTFNVLRMAAVAMATNLPDGQGERGVIINTTSVAAFEGQIGQVAYSAAKGGVASLTLPAARELARQAIRVVAIAPGVFSTPMMQALPEEVQQSLESQSVFPRRLGYPDEFAALAQHILENPMLNGCVLRLDGAVRLGPK